MNAEKDSVRPSRMPDSVSKLRYANRATPMSGPKAVKNTTIGMRAMNVSFVAMLRSPTTARSSPSAAWRDRRGMIAVSRVTPMMPYGTCSSSQCCW